MSKIDGLLINYKKYISIPWRDAAPAQRVVFCVYNENYERRLRAKIDEFEIATREEGHGWEVFDLTGMFAEWLSQQWYAERYFQQPHLIATLLPKFKEFIANQFKVFLNSKKIDSNTVVALKGVGSLFGFLKVKEVVDEISSFVPGRLLVFFPGSCYENNNYRLLDAYDGWNYLAVPITPDKDL